MFFFRGVAVVAWQWLGGSVWYRWKERNKVVRMVQISSTENDNQARYQGKHITISIFNQHHSKFPKNQHKKIIKMTQKRPPKLSKMSKNVPK
jgi:hypothetical protein